MSEVPGRVAAKVHVVPHGFDPAELRDRGRGAGAGRPLRIVYTGRFYDGIRTPEALLRALATLAAAPAARSRAARDVRRTPVPAHRRLAIVSALTDVVEFTGRVPFAESARRAAGGRRAAA